MFCVSLSGLKNPFGRIRVRTSRLRAVYLLHEGLLVGPLRELAFRMGAGV